MLKYLITNADDFGLTDGVNRAIESAIDFGTVSSTTIMINMPLAENAVRWVKEHDIKCTGIHLNLTCGRPVLSPSEVPSLVDERGIFYRHRPEMIVHAKPDDIRRELYAQVEKFLSFGLVPTHIDGHHHIQLYDEILATFKGICRDFKLPMRHTDDRVKEILKREGIRTTDHFTLKFYAENATIDIMKEIISDNWDGVLEIMLHPGYNDNDLESISSYNRFREKELGVLLSDEFMDLLDKNGVEAVSYDFLK